MRILNIGSMNLDLVYKVDHIVRSGRRKLPHRWKPFWAEKA